MATSNALQEALRSRSGDKCELCSGASGLAAHAVDPGEAVDADRSVWACEVCAPQLDPAAELDSRHWYCLKESIWSEVAAVQVTSWRLLKRLAGESWAGDTLEQAYLEESVQAWAEEGAADGDGAADATVDSNGTRLLEGDSVTLIKDLDVKGTQFTAKRGTVVKGIRLTGDPGNVEGRINKTLLVLKTEFLKKIS